VSDDSMVVFCFQRIENKRVYFINGNSAEFDAIVFCTGYKIDLPFLSSEVKKTILDENSKGSSYGLSYLVLAAV
jgi:hypothetical protein